MIVGRHSYEDFGIWVLLLRWRGCVRLLSLAGQVSGFGETGVGLIVIASSNRPWIDLVDIGLV